MNKKNRTLLIALSSILIVTLIFISIMLTISGSSSTKKTGKPVLDNFREELIAEKKLIVKNKLLPLDKIVQEVLEGRWGNGEERKDKLIAAGYDYDKIQEEINKQVPQPVQSAPSGTTVQYTPAPAGDYPTATEIWNTLTSWGWSPETCAGIIGNMMAECGGQTLNLNWASNGGSGFGLIQWMNGRYNLIMQLYGPLPSTQQQLAYMRDELFGSNGIKAQVSGDVLSVIMNYDGNQTPENIAMYFATYYERCASQYRAMRQGLARTAYEYFMSR